MAEKLENVLIRSYFFAYKCVSVPANHSERARLYQGPDRILWAAFLDSSLDLGGKLTSAFSLLSSVSALITYITQLSPSSMVYWFPSESFPNLVHLHRPPISELYSMMTKSETELLDKACCQHGCCQDLGPSVFPYGSSNTSNAGSKHGYLGFCASML
jgi:hypothetical protein